MSDQIVYTSKSRIERIKGPLRRAYLPLKLKPGQRETAERVHGYHVDFCPVARTIKGCVEISTELMLEDD